MLETTIQMQLLHKSNQDNIDCVNVGVVVIDHDHQIILNNKSSLNIPNTVLEEDEDLLDAMKRESNSFLNNSVNEVEYIGYYDTISESGKSSRQFNFLIVTESIDLISEDNLRIIEAYSPDWDNLHQVVSREIWDTLNRALMLADL
jgi:hypothetical protein